MEHVRAVLLEKVSSNRNVETINCWHHSNDWNDLIDLDVSLKNGIRIFITDCKIDKNKSLFMADFLI